MAIEGQSLQHLLCCNITQWLPKLQTLQTRIGEKFMPTTCLLSLSSDFIAYLRNDTLTLPRPPLDLTLSLEDPRIYYESPATNEANQLCFFELEREIVEKCKLLGGKTFIKLNWTSVRDTKWVTGDICCESPGKIFLLLKSSDVLKHDLFDVVEDVGLSPGFEGYVLTLKEWQEVDPKQEFRVFVQGNNIKKISQRNREVYLSYLEDKVYQEKVRKLVLDFFERILLPGFLCEVQLSLLSFDIHIDPKDKVWLLDINHAVTTSTCLDGDFFDFVTSESECEAPFSGHKVPLELVSGDLRSLGDIIN